MAKRKRENKESVDPVPVLLIGEPNLRICCEEVKSTRDALFIEEKAKLIATLEDFRAKNGFGRAISAPQIGITKRFIALNLGEGPFCMINPVITKKSEEMFTMWDDCMSFPWLLVKLERHKSIDVTWTDESGCQQQWTNISQANSELLQHEIDHLDGILAIDHALDKTSMISREVYEKMKDEKNKEVDYFIQPTISKN